MKYFYIRNYSRKRNDEMVPTAKIDKLKWTALECKTESSKTVNILHGCKL
uniref:Uncharacterized protein n=1 Tax=Enterobacter cloacae TaxID=550 RepID=A0A2L1KN76_ENTCL|nr:hypothetical protein [Enterobacter cloacae]